MFMKSANTANNAWRELADDVMKYGTLSAPRGIACRELIGYQSCIDMRSPLVATPGRNLGMKFAAAEAAWILSGDNKVETIQPYSKMIANFSDDDQRFFGAYGPKIIDQMTHVVSSIENDPDTRQAVINIWRENPRKTKDTPCTVSCQFIVRDDTIHAIDTMRSSDVWLGWPYDVFNFTMLAGFVALEIRERTGKELKMGQLILNAGSQHVYESNFEAIETALFGPDNFEVDQRFDPHKFNSPKHLVSSLWDAAREGNVIDIVS